MEKKINSPLTDLDIKNKINCGIVFFKDIKKYKSIDELLGKKKMKIILYEHEPGYGHWCCIFRNGNYLEFFNSYGDYSCPMPDMQLKKYNKRWKNKSGQNDFYLAKLMIKSPYKLNYNQYQFQSSDINVQTCGRWCIFRLQNKNLNTDQFCDKVTDLTQKYKISTDQLIVFVVPD